MSENESEETVIQLQFDEDGANYKKFETPEVFKEWIVTERDNWDWVPKNNTHGSTSTIKQHIDAIFSNAINNIDTAINHKNVKANYEKHLNNSITRLENSYKNRKIFLSDSPEAKFINTQRDKQVSIGAHAFAYLVKLDNIPFNHFYAVEGMIEAKIYEKGLSNSNIDSMNDSISDLIERTGTHLEDYKQEEIKLRDEFKNITEATDLLMTTHESTHKQKMQEYQDGYDEFIKQSNERLDNVNKAYNELMALKAPVKYWQDKVKTAYWQASGVFVIFGLFLGFGGNYMLKNGEAVLKLTKEQFHYGKAAYFILLVLIFFWLLRVIIQLLLSRLHLATEASEKAVMTQAYLSLLEEGKVDEDERELVLRSVFRPSGSGLIKEDHGHPALEVISKIMNKGS
tara:strand:+ start:209463 stop:210659 length:1197 start_codon:yes stop_codon:yes gene_type:complete